MRSNISDIEAPINYLPSDDSFYINQKYQNDENSDDNFEDYEFKNNNDNFEDKNDNSDFESNVVIKKDPK